MTTLLARYASALYGPATPFYSGDGSSSLVPFPFPVSVGGHAYAVQWDKDAVEVWGGRIKRGTLPLIRQQADNSSSPGEQSISPEQLWRRSQDSWQMGSGQEHLDRQNSLDHRYRTSKGINPWTPWKLSLLNDTSNVKSTGNSNLACLVAGTKVYFMNGTTLSFATGALSSWTDVTGTSATAASSICTDGNTVYIANGADGIYSSAVSGSTAASYATGTVSIVKFVKSRLMAAGGGKLYNCTTGGALGGSDLLLDLSTRGWTWVDIAGGQSQIYAAGYAGDKSIIYRTELKADGTALSVPIAAGELPDGEIVRSIHCYLSYVIIGTDIGVRFCDVNSDGSLTIGTNIPTTSPVYCLEPQDRFVWYGLTNYDSTSTGLGRMDLTNFTSSLTPAYASDIMATTQGTVRSVATFGQYRLFTVDGHGLYYETASTPVASGTISSGLIAYGVSDNKVAMYVDLKHEALNGTISATLSANGGGQVSIGSCSTAGTTVSNPPLSASQTSGEEFELTFTLTPSSNISPVLTRWTLRSYPTPTTSAQWDIPIILNSMVRVDSQDYYFDVAEEHDFLDGLHENKNIVNLQVGTQIKQVILFDSTWLPDKIDPKTGAHEGIFYANFREIAG
jgi:hypothetical protein